MARTLDAGHPTVRMHATVTQQASPQARAAEITGGLFRRLLVPINGNAASSVAIAFAIDIAQAGQGDLTFCYALDMRVLGMGSSLAIDPSWIDSLRPDADKVGRTALSRATEAACTATLQVLEGSAEDVVLRLAPSFDLVVMGTRAISGFAHVLDHSTTDAVVRACSRPVLVVRESDTPSTRRSSCTTFERLIVPIDGSKPSQTAIDVASALASQRDGEVVFVYALDVARATAFSGPYACDDGGAYEVMRRYGALLLTNTETVARAAGARSVRTRLVVGAPLEAILAEIAAESADAVIVGTHGRHGFDRAVHGSFTEDLMRKSPVPVLTLHPPVSNGA